MFLTAIVNILIYFQYIYFIYKEILVIIYIPPSPNKYKYLFTIIYYTLKVRKHDILHIFIQYYRYKIVYVIIIIISIDNI